MLRVIRYAIGGAVVAFLLIIFFVFKFDGYTLAILPACVVALGGGGVLGAIVAALTQGK